MALPVDSEGVAVHKRREYPKDEKTKDSVDKADGSRIVKRVVWERRERAGKRVRGQSLPRILSALSLVVHALA